MTQKKLYYTWNDLDNDVDILVDKIKNLDKKFDVIYGIPRGGLVLAVMLSHRLNIPLKADWSFMAHYNPKKVLIVDEISDTGKTLLEFPNIIRYTVVTIHSRLGTKFVPDIYVKELNDDNWIVYPWEQKITKKFRWWKNGTKTK